MKRLPLVTALSVLALPGSALAAAAPQHGTLLSIDRTHHEVQIVDAHKRVHEYRYRGSLGKLHPGSRLTFRVSGSTISAVSVQAGARTVSFYGRVVRSSSKGLVLRLADGKQVTFSSHQVVKHKQVRATHGPVAHMDGLPAGVTVNIQGLQPGVTVQVNETVDASGNVTITITLPASSVPGVTSSLQSSGVVTDVESDSFLVQTPDGSLLHMHMAQDSLATANLSVCDDVSVTYHQDDDLLIADSVNTTGTSTTGACAPDDSSQGDDSGSDGGDATGTITAVSAAGLTLSTSAGSTMTFTADDGDVTAGFNAGDIVDVSYEQADDGSLQATDVEYDEQDTVGTVTAVSDGSLTLTDANGQSDTFVADPNQGIFAGVAVGDQVEVASHGSATQQTADDVFDNSSSSDD